MTLAVFFIATLLPSSFEVSRETTIEKPAHVVYAALADLSTWKHWDPWQSEDNKLSIRIVSQTAEETKAVWLNEGAEAGQINLRIRVPNQELAIAIETLRVPPRLLSVRLQNLGGKTRVHFTVKGENGLYPLGNIFALQMEKYVGANYEEALNKLKTHLENK
tara:strand:+ start:167 stop:652 length:486 start_codon:yes stop_codon:yes gene_type:complete